MADVTTNHDGAAGCRGESKRYERLVDLYGAVTTDDRHFLESFRDNEHMEMRLILDAPVGLVGDLKYNEGHRWAFNARSRLSPRKLVTNAHAPLSASD
jgi:hypothetical protein